MGTMVEEVLDYGASETLKVRIAPSFWIGHYGRPETHPRTEPVEETVRSSLAKPLGFPALASAVLEDDAIAITVDHGVPQVSEIVTGIVGTLIQAGVQRSRIHVLLGMDGEDIHTVRRSMLDAGYAGVDIGQHDPSNRSTVSYLAADKKGRPVYLNRLVCDADLVISVGCLRASGSPAYWGIHAGIYPEFADASTHQRFLAPSSSLSAPRSARRAHEAEEASWLLGARFTVQSLPGPHGTILDVLAGDIDAVRMAGEPRVDQLWVESIPRRASLVIAALSGAACQQNWENLGRVMSAALEAVEVDGSIVLCTHIDRGAGPSLRRVASAVSPQQVHKHGEKHPTPDSLFASQLAEAQRNHRIYFLSRLHPEAVENLGMTPVADPHEVQNLCDRSESCLLISNAQYCRPVVAAGKHPSRRHP
jgi:nickel-dependent lactate racemase